jgi:hypothetical protein
VPLSATACAAAGGANPRRKTSKQLGVFTYVIAT